MVQTNIRLPDEIQEALAREAEHRYGKSKMRRRGMSNLITEILSEWCRERGLIK